MPTRLRDAARHLHAGRRAGTQGQLLRRPAQEGARDARSGRSSWRAAPSTRPRMTGKEYADWVAKAEQRAPRAHEGSGLPRQRSRPRAHGPRARRRAALRAAARHALRGLRATHERAARPAPSASMPRAGSSSSRWCSSLFGALVVWDSRRLGSRWASDGPQAGYFPFYIGLIICIASVANLIAALGDRRQGRARPSSMRGQLQHGAHGDDAVARLRALIAIPLCSGIYVASAIFIAFFMR